LYSLDIKLTEYSSDDMDQ